MQRSLYFLDNGVAGATLYLELFSGLLLKSLAYFFKEIYPKYFKKGITYIMPF